MKSRCARSYRVPCGRGGNSGDRLGSPPITRLGGDSRLIEAELAMLSNDTADRSSKTSGSDTVENYLRDRELAFKRLTASFEIDRAGKALTIAVRRWLCFDCPGDQGRKLCWPQRRDRVPGNGFNTDDVRSFDIFVNRCVDKRSGGDRRDGKLTGGGKQRRGQAQGNQPGEVWQLDEI